MLPDFDIDTHIDVYDREIRDIEADTRKTIESLESMLNNLADATEELASTLGRVAGCPSIDRPSLVPMSLRQSTSPKQLKEMNFCDEARKELMEES